MKPPGAGSHVRSRWRWCANQLRRFRRRRLFIVVLPPSACQFCRDARPRRPSPIRRSLPSLVPSADHNGTLPGWPAEGRSLSKTGIPRGGVIDGEIASVPIGGTDGCRKHRPDPRRGGTAVPHRECHPRTLYDFVSPPGLSGTAVSRPRTFFHFSCMISVTPTFQTIASNAVASGGSGGANVVTKQRLRGPRQQRRLAEHSYRPERQRSRSGRVRRSQNTSRDPRTGTADRCRTAE